MAISESSAKSSLTTLYSPLLSSSQGKSVTPGIPARPKTVKLRRSNSTSSVARPISARSRPQQVLMCGMERVCYQSSVLRQGFSFAAIF